MMNSEITRREAIATLSAIGAAATLPLVPAQAAGPSLNFLAVGDWGRDGASHQRDVATQMGALAERIRSRFVVSVGDNFYENGVQTAQDAQWKTSFEDIYTARSLHRPWLALLGNHDYRGNPQAQLDYARTSHRWRMPSRYYKVDGASFGAPHVDMFMLDTSPLVHSYREKVESTIKANVESQDTDAQLRWLDTGLGRSRAAWKLVFGHHTIYSGGSEHGNTPELVALVKPILEQHGVQAYINGHEHDLQHIHLGGIDYICAGAGSEVRPVNAIEGTRFCRSVSGFAALRLRGDSLALEFRDYQGSQIYGASLARERSTRAA